MSGHCASGVPWCLSGHCQCHHCHRKKHYSKKRGGRPCRCPRRHCLRRLLEAWLAVVVAAVAAAAAAVVVAAAVVDDGMDVAPL